MSLTPHIPEPGDVIRGHLSRPGDGKEQATIDRFGTKTLKLAGNWLRIWATSGETYIDVRGNGPSSRPTEGET